jgi:hypothetical protein
MALVGAVGVELLGDVEVCRRFWFESFRQHAQHFISFAAEGDAFTYDIAVSVQPVFPKRIGEHSKFARIGNVFRGGERPSKSGGNTENVEEIRRGFDCPNGIGTVARTKVQREPPEIVGRNAIE